MATLPYIQTNFTAGELSPRIIGRIDLSKYYNGVEKLENMIIHPLGGVIRRSGTRFVAAVKNSAHHTHLIPFEFSIEQAYILEFGNNYIRFFTNEGQVESSPGVIYEVTTPYAHTDLELLKFTQSADVMYLVHPDYAPRKLSRLGPTNWTLAAVDFKDGPYGEENVNAAKTLTPSAVSGSITITATGHTPFVSTDVGRLIRIKYSSAWGYAKISGYTSSTVVNATVITNFGATTASSTWQLGSWSDTTGWPAAVEFFEQRLFFAATKSQPQTLWGSASDDYESFKPDINDDDAVAYTINASRVNAIRWLSPGDILAIGTAGGEFKAGGGVNGEDIITPSSMIIKRQTNHGVADTSAVVISNVIIFVQRAGRKLREFSYSFERDGYNAPDLTILAEHVSDSGLLDIAYAQEPDSVVWGIRNDGTLIGMTYKREEDVIGWHRHTIGGNGLVKSIAVIPNEADAYDQLWMVVAREIDGNTVKYVEFMEKNYDRSQPVESAFFVDSGLSYSGSATSTISGLDHLEGETVAVLADGATHPNCVVSSGEVTLNRAVTEAQIGLPYISRIRSLRYEAGSPAGTAQGAVQRVHEVICRFHDTLGAKIGPSDDILDEIPFRTADDPMDAPPSLVTGDREISFPGGYVKGAQIEVVQDQPLPMMLLGLIAKLTTNIG